MIDLIALKGNFRDDLFFRINVVTMEIPPLRERKEDIQDLIHHFLKRFSERNGKALHSISRDALNLLVKYDYPGNVHELENILERAVVITRDTSINIEDLPFKAEGQISFKEPAWSEYETWFRPQRKMKLRKLQCFMQSFI